METSQIISYLVVLVVATYWYRKKANTRYSIIARKVTAVLFIAIADDILTSVEARKSISLTKFPGPGEPIKTDQLHDLEIPNINTVDPSDVKIEYELIVDGIDEFERKIRELTETNWQISRF